MPPVVKEQTLNPWSAREPPNLLLLLLSHFSRVRLCATPSHSVVFLSFLALIAEAGFLISPCYSLDKWTFIWAGGFRKDCCIALSMLIAQDTEQPCFREQLPDNINLHLDTELQFRCSLRPLHCIAPGLQMASWFSDRKSVV